MPRTTTACARALLERTGMLGRISQSQALARQVRLAIEANQSKFGVAPTVMLVTDDVGLCAMLDKRLRDRGCNVVIVRDAASFHARICADDLDCDVLVIDDALAGCSPFHGLACARRRGLEASAIALVKVENAHARTEARRLDLVLCARAVVLGSIDRVLLPALRRCLDRRVSHAA